MPADGTTDSHRLTLPPPPPPNGSTNGSGPLQVPTNSNYRLRLNPHQDHKPESYDDLQSEFTPLLFSSLEKYLPPNMLNVSRETKHTYMRQILRRYSDEGERNRVRLFPISYLIVPI
nr:uncharacterized PKHD-type hydroxylase At1g22950-like [Tanacetum cinerariifolium]